MMGTALTYQLQGGLPHDEQSSPAPDGGGGATAIGCMIV